MKLKLLFTLLVSVSLYSQVPKGFSLAVMGTQSNLNSDVPSFEPGNGFGAGFSYHYGYHETFNYQVDALYNQSSIAIPYTEDTGSKGTEDISLKSIDVLLYLNYYIIVPEEDKFYAGVQGGGFVTFYNQAWSLEGSESRTYDGNLKYDSFESMKKFNGGLTFGIIGGYNRFKLSLKYNLAMTNALNGVQTDEFNDNNSYTGPALDGKLNSMTLTLYYKLFK